MGCVLGVEPKSTDSKTIIKSDFIDPAIVSKTWAADKMTEGLNSMADSERAAKEDALRAPVLPIPPKPGKGFLAKVSSWQFDLFEEPYGDLPKFAYNVLISNRTVASSKVDKAKLWRYVCELAEWYHPRPFHNFRHAVDVLLATTYLCQEIEKESPQHFQNGFKVAALLISALVHDTDHPGVMNGYLIATKHPLAQLRDPPVAVLEHHHATMAIALLKHAELNFMHAFSQEEQDQFVALIRENVLNTDVSTTMPTAKEFEQKGRRPSQSVIEFNDQLNNHRTSGVGGPSATLLFSMIIKAADISNPARKLAIYERWIDGIMKEFFAQGDAERAMGLTISMNCDRETVMTAKAQVGFITFLVAPLFKSLVSYAPGLQPLLDQLDNNKAHFAALAAGS